MTEITKCVLILITGIVCAVCMIVDSAWTPFALICFGIVAIVVMKVDNK